MNAGNAIELKYQHDHIEDCVLVYSTQECLLYLLCKNTHSEPSFIKIEFQETICVRSASTDCSPAIGIYPKNPSKSFLVELTESNWATEAHKKYTYADSPLKPRGRHFVVSNHDIFHEILAESFSESLIEKEALEYEFIKKFFSN